MAMLSIVPTPIGNLQDITIRAIRVLFEVDCIFTEEVSRTKNLLDHLQQTYPDITGSGNIPKIIQFNEFSENAHFEKYAQILEDGQNVALVSSAGTPVFSDPGFRLIQFAIKQNIPVTVLPGATAAIPALVASGMPTDQVFFTGFLPKKDGKKEKLLLMLRSKIDDHFHPTIIVYESPHRIINTLEMMQKIFGKIPICICRELTKIHEEILFSNPEELLVKYRTNTPRGEFVMVFQIT